MSWSCLQCLEPRADNLAVSTNFHVSFPELPEESHDSDNTSCVIVHCLATLGGGVTAFSCIAAVADSRLHLKLYTQFQPTMVT